MARMRQCRGRCQQERPTSDFYRGRGPDGLMLRCKVCHRRHQAALRQQEKKERDEALRAQRERDAASDAAAAALARQIREECCG